MTSPLVSLLARKPLSTSIPSKFNHLHLDPASHPLEAEDALLRRVYLSASSSESQFEKTESGSRKRRVTEGVVDCGTRPELFESILEACRAVRDLHHKRRASWRSWRNHRRSRSFAGNFPHSNHSLSNSKMAWTHQKNLCKIPQAALSSKLAQTVEIQPSNSLFPTALFSTIPHGSDRWRHTLVSTVGYC